MVKTISQRQSSGSKSNGNPTSFTYDQYPLYRSPFTCCLKHGNSTGKNSNSPGGITIPDWFTHSLVGWITGKTTKTQVALVVIGALIPDISKLALFSRWIGSNFDYFFHPIHTPVGALLIACIITLFFENTKISFAILSIGIATHFILDLFLINVSGGMTLIFPFSWNQWQLNLIRSDDYSITILAIIAATLVYLMYNFHEKKRKTHKEKIHKKN
jgi:hypothetical protein